MLWRDRCANAVPLLTLMVLMVGTSFEPTIVRDCLLILACHSWRSHEWEGVGERVQGCDDDDRSGFAGGRVI
ncbi:hypothetical protein KC19_3G069500 [Ceratodon purpureus]|uniref:Secreted protein n=1 Tax=Ceratodon purpureus TaxID=3225 RepID=A0A8T0II26_CERPU|nr:hypothetical protein KC19_3G069500 [Ceratodon purpureus]